MPQKRGRLRLCLCAPRIAAQKPDLFRMSRDSKMMELPPTGRRNYDSGTTQHQNLLRGRMKSTHFRLSNISSSKTASSPIIFKRSYGSIEGRDGRLARSPCRDPVFDPNPRSERARGRIAVGFYGACSHLGKTERVKRIPPSSPSFLGIPEIPFLL